MHCVNPTCNKEIEASARFCPYCRAEQLMSMPEPAMNGTTVIVSGPAPERSATPVRIPSTDDLLVMRAGDKVWHFEEAEGALSPGKKRPLLILDEEVVHLAHTDRRLDPRFLLERVKAQLQVQKVPVEVRQVQAYWLRDPTERRARLVASLMGHTYSDIKMLLGVDYLGAWASIHLLVGAEPEPMPEPPRHNPPADGLLAAALGGLMLLVAFGMVGSALDMSNYSFGAMSPTIKFGIAAALCLMGAPCLLYGITRWMISAQQHNRKVAEAQEAWEQQQARKRLSRTFKIDDIRLFCSAMKAVFQSVVDDIVAQGGEVTRIEGGQGGFFQAEGVTRADATPRRSDAAQVGV